MEYHNDRFKDYSLLIYDNDKLISILPANVEGDTLYSHQGLTFGSFLVDDKMKTETILEIFEVLKKFLKKRKIQTVVYKCIPYIYHIKPSEEDRYALFRNDAKLIRRDVSSTIYLTEKITYQERRRRAIKKAIKNELTFEKSKDFKSYWDILERTLEGRHNAKPVHSLEEIKNLAGLFPEHIKLFIAKKDNEVLGGTLVFENEKIVHTQYLANSLKGRDLGALDFVINKLISEI